MEEQLIRVQKAIRKNINSSQFFGRVNYGYDDRYLFEFNIRHDGSSRMPKANRYATFPSVSGGWVFSNEELNERL